MLRISLRTPKHLFDSIETREKRSKSAVRVNIDASEGHGAFIYWTWQQKHATAPILNVSALVVGK